MLDLLMSLFWSLKRVDFVLSFASQYGGSFEHCFEVHALSFAPQWELVRLERCFQVLPLSFAPQWVALHIALSVAP